MTLQTLPLLLKLSEQQLLEAEQILRRTQDKYAQANRQLEHLLQFQQEYRQRLLGEANSGLGIGQYQNYQRFLGQLDEAIRLARAELLQQQSHCEQALGRRREIRQRQRLYEAMAQRQQAHRCQQDLRNSQKQQDEWVLGHYARAARAATQ